MCGAMTWVSNDKLIGPLAMEEGSVGMAKKMKPIQEIINEMIHDAATELKRVTAILEGK